MKNDDLLNLLADHADALNESGNVAGFDTAVWLNQYPQNHATHLLPLLQLAKAVKLTLHPVNPPTLYRIELRQQLEQLVWQAVADHSIGRFIWLIAALLGSILSLIVILRRLKLLPGGDDVVGTAV